MSQVELGEEVDKPLLAIYQTIAELNDYFVYFQKKLNLNLGNAFDIDLIDWSLFAQQPYHTGSTDLDFARAEVGGLCDVGVEEPSILPWAFAALVVHREVKGVDKRRLAIDFGPLTYHQ